MKLALNAAGVSTPPERVCANCFSNLTGKVSQGVKLRLEAQNKEKNKLKMWKSRVNLIKEARTLMTKKAYSEAAVCYEKYIRVLEIVYGVKKGGLNPEVFSKSKRSKEMTVLASVYWDLMRIYDTSPRYGNRMQTTAQKLAEFLPFTPIYPDIAKKCESFLKASKNPHVVRSFMKEIKAGGGGCFIATAAFEGAYTSEVLQLRRFREDYLRPSPLGRRTVVFYYRYSPPIARFLNQHPQLKPPVRWVVRRLCSVLPQKST
ncbi:MAG: hypothetical protein KDD22_04615 [Bdellovibrionales bacterium]|nr:hypothetical protein [Bdellovibrionales bacterium]